MEDYIRFSFTDKIMTLTGREPGNITGHGGYDVICFRDEEGNCYKYRAPVDRRGRDMSVFGKCCRACDIGARYVVSGSAVLTSLPFDGNMTDVYEMFEPRTEVRFTAGCAV